MRPDEIILALDVCTGGDLPRCHMCPLEKDPDCIQTMMLEALDYIRKKEEGQNGNDQGG